MKFTRRLVILNLAALIVLTGAAAAQTRKSPVRRKRAASVRVQPKTPTAKLPAAPVSAATTTASGLTLIVTEKSDGAPLKAGDAITVHYTGLLTNGVKFDSSRDRGEPFSFDLGAGKVIKGWDEAFQKLRVGERATIIIPPALGYGARGAEPVIPPGATLIFIVEVIGVANAAPIAPND